MTQPKQRSEADRHLIERAALFARKAHAGKKYGNRVYEEHLWEVIVNLATFHADEDANTVAAAYLHDVLEDTGTTLEDLQKRFPSEVVRLVEAVTDEPGENREERKARTYPVIRAAGKEVVAIKLADRMANVEASRWGGDGEKMKMYRKEQPAFHEALYREGELEAMWEKLAILLRAD